MRAVLDRGVAELGFVVANAAIMPIWRERACSPRPGSSSTAATAAVASYVLITARWAVISRA